MIVVDPGMLPAASRAVVADHPAKCVLRVRGLGISRGVNIDPVYPPEAQHLEGILASERVNAFHKNAVSNRSDTKRT